MSFGHGLNAKTHDFRALPLGVGACTALKEGGLRDLREACLAALKHFAAIGFCAEPLSGTLTKKELSQRLTAAQKAYTGLNKGYAEKCRIQVATALAEQNRRYARQLLGRLRHCHETIPEADRKADANGGGRRYWYVPVSCQDTATADELLELATRALDRDVAFGFFRQMLAGDRTGFTDVQFAVLAEVHRQVQERHRPPEFGGPAVVVALPLDYRLLSSRYKLLPDKLESVVSCLLHDATNRTYQLFLDIAHPTPGQPRLRLPLLLNKEQLERLVDDRRRYRARGITVLLGRDRTEVRLTVAQPKRAAAPLDEVRFLLARDFGQKNTTTLSLIALEQALDAATVKELQSLDKAEAFDYLTHSVAPAQVDIVERWRHSGARFLARVNRHAERVDNLRSAIDQGYAELERRKKALAQALHLEPDADGLLPRIKMRQFPADPPLREQAVAFFRLLSHLKNLKANRREAYRCIAAVKRCWFGHLANIEVAIARQYGAAVVTEALNYVTPEQGSPQYKGRTFNKVMNHASRGQFARRASATHAWNGIPVVAIPSYYTSTTCTRHSHVHARYRRGDVFRCPACRKEGRPLEHADEHAADTIGLYLVLRPKVGLVTNMLKS